MLPWANVTKEDDGSWVQHLISILAMDMVSPSEVCDQSIVNEQGVDSWKSLLHANSHFCQLDHHEDSKVSCLFLLSKGFPTKNTPINTVHRTYSMKNNMLPRWCWQHSFTFCFPHANFAVMNDAEMYKDRDEVQPNFIHSTTEGDEVQPKFIHGGADAKTNQSPLRQRNLCT